MDYSTLILVIGSQESEAKVLKNDKGKNKLLISIKKKCDKMIERLKNSPKG